jgi:hypothetical protein
MNFRHANHVARSSLHRINNYEWQRQHTLSLCVRTRAVRAVACKRDVTPAIWRDFFRLNASAPCKRASFDAGIFDGSSHELGFDFERRAREREREREFWLTGTHLWPFGHRRRDRADRQDRVRIPASNSHPTRPASSASARLRLTERAA